MAKERAPSPKFGQKCLQRQLTRHMALTHIHTHQPDDSLGACPSSTLNQTPKTSQRCQPQPTSTIPSIHQANEASKQAASQQTRQPTQGSFFAASHSGSWQNASLGFFSRGKDRRARNPSSLLPPSARVATALSLKIAGQWLKWGPDLV